MSLSSIAANMLFGEGKVVWGRRWYRWKALLSSYRLALV